MFILGALALNVYVFKITWSSKSASELTPSFKHLAKHCADVLPIGASEFHTRQTALANALHSLGAVAYIAEPGANAEFFGNISSSQWHLSERPLLLIVSPEEEQGAIIPKIGRAHV